MRVQLARLAPEGVVLVGVVLTERLAYGVKQVS